MARRDVAVGQRYRATGAVAVWEVVGLTQDPEGVPHARIVRVGDATATKMMSVSALKDAKLYQLVSDVP